MCPKALSDVLLKKSKALPSDFNMYLGIAYMKYLLIVSMVRKRS